MPLQRDPTFCDEHTGNIALRLADSLALDVSVRFWKEEAEDNEENRRAGAKPKEWSPSVACGVDEPSGKHRREQIAEGVPLLEHTAEDPSRRLWTVFQCRRRCVTIQAAHGNTEEGSTGQELLVRVAESCAEFQYDEQDVVHDERPLAPISIRCNTKDGTSD